MVKQTGIELLQETHAGLQILDAAGNEVYAYQEPDRAWDCYSRGCKKQRQIMVVSDKTIA